MRSILPRGPRQQTNRLGTVADRLRNHAKALKQQTLALYLACRDPRTPWYAKALGAFIIGYALSPIDLIPDFIPILGYLDDLVVVPLGIALLLRMIPPQVVADSRQKAAVRFTARRPTNRLAALVIVAVWAAAMALAAVGVYRLVTA